MQTLKNLLGEELEPCSVFPRTGFFRTGTCQTGAHDRGSHVVCAEVTEAFLRFTKSRGNDLSTPAPQYGFPGLKPGERWCLCALRWREVLEAGAAPPVILSATHEASLRSLRMEDLRAHALDAS